VRGFHHSRVWGVKGRKGGEVLTTVMRGHVEDLIREGRLLVTEWRC
jgi:hypothetical protein